MSLTTQKFQKDINLYDEKDAIMIVDECLNFCKSLLEDFIEYIERYYTTNTNNYVQNRIYNPKVYIQFEDKSELEKMNPSYGYKYIEVSKEDLKSKYELLLKHFDDENQYYKLANSIYDFIVVIDNVSREKIGYLKPNDGELYLRNDGRPLVYREYDLKTGNVERQIIQEFYVNKKQLYYDTLYNDVDVIIGKPE